jgi:hypothetical protein
LVLVLLAPSIRWVLEDRSVWPWDQAMYGEGAVELWYSLTHSLHEWKSAMLGALGTKPPALVWFGQFFVPLGTLLGSIEASLLLFIVLTQAATLLLLFRTGTLTAPKTTLVAAIGVLSAAGGHLVVGLSHQYFVEPLQTLSVAWVFLVATRAHVWTRARLLVHVGSALLLGVMTKTTTPLYCLAPCLYLLFVFLRRRDPIGFYDEARSLGTLLLVLASLALGPLGALWYKRNLAEVWRHVLESSTGETALGYGYRAPLAAKFQTWAVLTQQAFLDPVSWWGCLVLVLLCVVAVLYRRKDPAEASLGGPTPLALAGICVAQIALVLFAFSNGINMDTRFLLPLLPSIATLVMALSSLLPRPALVGLATLFAWQWVSAHKVAAGEAPPSASRSPYLTGKHRDPSRYEELTRLIQATSRESSRYSIIGIEKPWFNANSASFFAAKGRLSSGTRCYYTSLGYAEKDTRAALQRVDELRAAYVATLDEPFQAQPADFLNRVSLPVLREIENDPRFSRVPFESRQGIVLFQRVR